MDIEYYLPEKTLTNLELCNQFPNWDYINFEKKIGIKERHISGENETALDMAEKASNKLFDKIDKGAVDFIILCTQSPDYFLPTSACILQKRLSLGTNCGALDIDLGCSGYVYGLALSKGLLKSKIASNVLFVVSETYSKYIHPRDKANRTIFGDAATATLIKENSFSIGEFILGTDGSGYEKLIVKNGGQRNKLNYQAVEYEYGSGNVTSDNYLYMDGPDIFNFTLKTVPDLVLKTAEKNNLSLDDVDYFIFHQANESMLNFLRAKVKIPVEKFCIDFEKTGNTVSSTIPIALKNAYIKAKICKGSKVMLVGFGVGLSWGATIITI